MNLERMEKAISELKISSPVKIDLQARLQRASEEVDEIDRRLLLEDLRHEIHRLSTQVLDFKSLYDGNTRDKRARRA